MKRDLDQVVEFRAPAHIRWDKGGRRHAGVFGIAQEDLVLVFRGQGAVHQARDPILDAILGRARAARQDGLDHAQRAAARFLHDQRTRIAAATQQGQHIAREFRRGGIAGSVGRFSHSSRPGRGSRFAILHSGMKLLRLSSGLGVFPARGHRRCAL